jgi:hypothetical protein
MALQRMRKIFLRASLFALAQIANCIAQPGGGDGGSNATLVYNAAQLTEAVARFGATGVDTSAALVSSFSLANATFPSLEDIAAASGSTGRQPFTSGVFKLYAASSNISSLRVGQDGDRIVLDLAMRAGLTPHMGPGAAVHLNGFTIVNLCEAHFQISFGGSSNGSVFTDYTLGLFSAPLNRRTVVRVKAIVITMQDSTWQQQCAKGSN